jgi:predicted house-cleaning noncanonical NTP pyrophosphatase (MazG superfamily)
MKVVKYDKLVRDKIPQIIEKSGKQPVIEVLGTEAYKRYLDKKLSEELQEYTASDSPDELADLIEVVYAILKYKKMDISDFEKLRNKKADDRGAFDKRILLKEVVED